MGGSRLEAELVQIAAPWPVDSSRPRLGSWSNISDHQPVHGQRGGQRGALPPHSGGSPPLKEALVGVRSAHPLRMRNGKGWVKEWGRVPTWCPLPPRSPRSSAGRAMGGRGGPLARVHSSVPEAGKSARLW